MSFLMDRIRKLILYALEAGASLLVSIGAPVRLARKLVIRRQFRSVWTGTTNITMACNARCERLLG